MGLSFRYYKSIPLISAIVVLVGLHSYVSSLIKSLPIWVPSITITTFITVIFLLYDKLCWKKVPFLLNIRDISGRYEGKLTTSYQQEKEIDIAIEISQSSSHIYIRQFNHDGLQNTKSFSVNENIERRKDGSIKISFAYKNEGVQSSAKYDEHSGFCVLTCTINKKKISGYYFTNRNPPTKGDIEVSFKNKKLKGSY